MEVRPVEHGHPSAPIFGYHALDSVGDIERLVLSIESGIDANRRAGAGVGPKRFAFALHIIRHHCAGGFQNSLGGAIVLLQPDNADPRIIVFEIQNVADVRPTPAINGLIFIANHADVLVALGQQPHQLVLRAVSVLILVDHQIVQAVIVGLARGFIVEQQPHCFQQQIVKIERIGVVQRLLILIEDHRQPGHARVHGALVKILRRLFFVLGFANR